jgi:hypothetical protein
MCVHGCVIPQLFGKRVMVLTLLTSTPPTARFCSACTQGLEMLFEARVVLGHCPSKHQPSSIAISCLIEQRPSFQSLQIYLCRLCSQILAPLQTLPHVSSTLLLLSLVFPFSAFVAAFRLLACTFEDAATMSLQQLLNSEDAATMSSQRLLNSVLLTRIGPAPHYQGQFLFVHAGKAGPSMQMPPWIVPRPPWMGLCAQGEGLEKAA